MKKLLLLIFLLTISFGYSQGLSQGFETGGINGAPFASGAAPTVTREAGPGTNTTQVVKFVGNTGSALWQGVNLSLTTNLNLTAATTRTMSIDVYASGPLFFLVKVNGGIAGAPEAAAVVSYTGTNTWQTCSFTFNSVRDGKAAAANGTYAGFVLHAYWPDANATVFPAGNAPARTLYVDNITGPLALPTATVGTFTVPAKLVGDATFTITPPTSNNTSAFTYTSSNTAVGTIVNGNQIQVGSIGSATITAAQVSDGTYAATSTTATFNVVPAAAPTPPVRAAIDVVSVFSDAYTVGVASPAFGASTSVVTGGTDTARLYTSSNNGVLSFTSTTAAAGMTHLHMDIFSTTASAAQMLIQINGVNSSNRLTPNGVWTSLDIPASAWAAGFGASLSSIGILPFAGSGNFYVDNVYFYRLPLLTGNIYINDGTFAAGDYCTAAGQDIAANDGTTAKPFLTLAYALTRSSQAAGTIFYVDVGTYSWSAVHTFTASGTLASPIIIQGKGNAATIITSTASANSGLYFSTGNYWTVKDLQWNATTAWSARVDTAIGITFQNCIFNFTGTGTTIQSVVMANAGGQLTIKNCTLSRSNTAFHMIEVVAGTSITLQDNTIRFSALAAVGTASSVQFAANAGSVLIMERNKLFGGGYGVGFVAAGTIAANASTIIKNNFFSTNWGIVNTQLTGLKVYNNSFYTANNCLYGITPAFMNNWDIQNNILYTYNAAACVFVNATTASTMNYNHYYYPNAGVGAGAVNLNGTTSSLATWKASANPAAIRETNGQGGNVSANNPLYTNIASLATTDLHLQGTSPAIGVGSSSLVTDDIDGDARPLGGTYDIGSDEVVPGVPTITNFPAISKVMGDAPFTLGTPTSNSSGAWTYSITTGNGTVANISGATVTLVAPGTATLRATQSADGTYSSGYIEATLTVTPSTVPLAGPTAPPARNAWDAFSVFSDAAYPLIAGTRNYNPGWGQAGSATLTTAGTDNVWRASNLNYQGIQFGSNADVSAMTHFHVDVWTFDETSLQFFQISNTTGERSVALAAPYPSLTQGSWISYDIPLTAWTSQSGFTTTALKEFKIVGSGGKTIYMDNMYFYRSATTQPPTFGSFTVPSKLLGDAAFTLTPPTSNSAGAFTFASSNTAVATISGSTVTVVGEGTSTITATQAANGSYGTGSTTANLIVTRPPPPSAPTPPARNSSNVVSLYSDSYTATSGATWQAGTDILTAAGNNARYFNGFTLARLAFAARSVSAMTTLHIDVYTLNQNQLWFEINSKRKVVSSIPLNGWVSFDIPLSDYVSASLDLTNVSFFDLNNPTGAEAPNKVVYLDNIYFYKQDTWVGTTSTNWATTTNWASGSVPTSTSDVLIAASANQPIISSIVGGISSLTINSGATLTVNSGFNLTVANVVANSGTMTLQNNANLLQDAATTTNSNSGSITVKRNSSSLLRLDHTLWSSPVASQNLFSFSPATLTNRFYVYDTAANGYSTSGLSGTTTFANGKGYAVRAPNDHSSTTPAAWTGTFTGVPNNGTVPFTLVTGGSGYNLVGNPYPSPINASSFLTENTAKIFGTLYFYAHSLTMNADGSFPSGTNYSTWNTTAGVAATTAASGDFHPIPVTPNGVIQVGQGFFVKATAAGNVNFTNAMRVGNNADQFLRTTEIERHRLWLNLTTDNDNDINQIAVAYVEGATQGVDTNFDGLSFGNTGSSLSSKINVYDYVIQGRSLPFDSNDVVALGFNAATAGNYKIKLTNKDGLFLGSQDVFVRDNLMGTEHNITIAPYSFATQAGTFDNRFQLVYTQRLASPSSTFTANSVLVTNNPDGFRVTTNGIAMKDIHVYDISGRLLFKQLNINETATDLKMFSQANQMLLLKITSQENETVTVKAIN